MKFRCLAAETYTGNLPQVVRSFPNDSLSVNPPTPITCFFAAEDCRQESSDKRGDGHVMWWSYFPPAETSDFAAIKL